MPQHLNRASDTLFYSKVLLAISTLTFTLLLQGCSTIVGATTEEPITINPGERTWGEAIDDGHIETVAEVNLNKTSPVLKESHINVYSYNAVVLLTGQVPDNDTRDLATSVVSKISKVRQVFNELKIQGTTSVLTRMSDSVLEVKLKAKLIAHEDIDSGRIKVIAENGVVYLMGLLSRIEAEKAADVVRNTGGVQKVVKAIEYID